MGVCSAVFHAGGGSPHANTILPTVWPLSLADTDAELLRRARFHDAVAWQTLYARHLPMAWRFAVRQVGDGQDAEDVVAEAMLALLKLLDEPDCELRCLPTWLRGVIRHKAADLFRKQGRQRRATEVLATLADIDGQDNPSTDRLALDELRDEVSQTLASIPDRYQVVLELKYYEELSVREIAARNGETEKAVEALLYRARREFRRKYEHRSGSATTLNGVAASLTRLPSSSEGE